MKSVLRKILQIKINFVQLVDGRRLEIFLYTIEFYSQIIINENQWYILSVDEIACHNFHLLHDTHRNQNQNQNKRLFFFVIFLFCAQIKQNDYICPWKVARKRHQILLYTIRKKNKSCDTNLTHGKIKFRQIHWDFWNDLKWYLHYL